MKNKSGLPNFLIIGAPKSGTTSIYNWLKQHPEVFMPPVKEPGYFAYADANHLFFDGKKYSLPSYKNNWQDYVDLFHKSEGYHAIGEASPIYLRSPDAPKLINARLPEVKLIAILRNPIERAYSHYLMGVRDGWISVSFSEALKLEERNKTLFNYYYLNPYHCYRSAGCYSEQIKRYWEFFPENRLKLYFYDDLKKDPKSIYEDICDFLNIQSEKSNLNFTQKHNSFSAPKHPMVMKWLGQPQYGNPFRKLSRFLLPRKFRDTLRNHVFTLATIKKNKPPITENDLWQLIEYFRPQIEELQNLLGRDVSSWLNESSGYKI